MKNSCHDFSQWYKMEVSKGCKPPKGGLTMMQHGPTLFRTEPASFWLCLGFPSDKDIEGAVFFAALLQMKFYTWMMGDRRIR